MAGLSTLEPLDDDFAVKSNAHSLTHLSSPSDLTVDFIQGLASQHPKPSTMQIITAAIIVIVTVTGVVATPAHLGKRRDWEGLIVSVIDMSQSEQLVQIYN
ncbi:hypothetical protein GGP41_002220 [Bipolaris sorokiniana]|uniref:Uncharacterized protein n=2 Tax=Cochliobolus sativus TaxID=45130 RepID=A0A8H6DQ88_COCSA|nr:uncharacterized protein COCSADRAFT_351184 [Bipolaris sorokiniana ND90Pr]EMD58237.1 hypothetical protein COCSADRAFT_351184 [Bipolaris sorokiniana ND90Pr]KAF5843992.1 hypothetical protein GGP41_002220 [Bipolaris sorokiniana]